MVAEADTAAAAGELQRCRIQGHDIAYRDAGSGEVVLLVHGITTYSFIWRRLVPKLAERHRVICVDLLGCGDSDKPLEVEYSIRNHAALLADFVDALGIERFHFVGHDVGGGVGQIYAVRHSERLYDITVINTVAYDFWPVQPIIAMRTPILRQFVMATLDIGALRLLVRRGLYHKDRLTPELMDWFWAPMRTRAGRKAFLHFARCLDNQNLLDISAQLRQLQLPLLIIRGEGDLYLTAEISERLASEVPTSRLVRIPTGGHFIQEDEPELLVATLTEFFSERADGNGS